MFPSINFYFQFNSFQNHDQTAKNNKPSYVPRLLLSNNSDNFRWNTAFMDLFFKIIFVQIFNYLKSNEGKKYNWMNTFMYNFIIFSPTLFFPFFCTTKFKLLSLALKQYLRKTYGCWKLWSWKYYSIERKKQKWDASLWK